MRLALIAPLLLASCLSDETVSAHGAADRVWRLTELDGAPFSARATLTFPEPGRIAGQASCNRYAGTMTAPYPWFDAGNITATRLACPDLAAEAAYLSALAEMTQSEVAGTVLILRNEDGREMVFSAAD